MKDVTDTEFPITHDGKRLLVQLVMNPFSQSIALKKGKHLNFFYACAKVAVSRCKFCHTSLLSELHSLTISRRARIVATVLSLRDTWVRHRAAATKIPCNKGLWTAGFLKDM